MVCDKKFIKVENCTANVNYIQIQRCDLVNGKVTLIYDIVEPIEKCMVSQPFLKIPKIRQKCENCKK
jgi:hypothetical protein